MEKIDGLHFQPWIGEEYYKGRKLLLLGESHYLDAEPDEEDFSAGYGDITTDAIRNFLTINDMPTPFFRNTGLIFYPDDCFKIWNEVSFANLIQIALPRAKSQPGPKEIGTIAPAFKLLLDNLKPERVLVLSKRLLIWIPKDNGSFVSEIEEEGKKSTVWKFDYLGGNCLAMGINHPSRMFGNDCYLWKPIVDKFLSGN